MDFIEKIYKITTEFPRKEEYGLISQIRRASTSIALNIAEGSGTSSDKDFGRFLNISLRSVYEVMCGIEISQRLGYCLEKDTETILRDSDELAAMINGFIKKLKAES